MFKSLNRVNTENKMKIKINNKRSEVSGEMIMMIPQLIFLIAVLFAFVILVKTLIVTHVDVRGIDASIFAERLLFSPNGISYFDGSIERVYPGIIDLEEFRQINDDPDFKLDRILVNYGSDNPIMAAKLTLAQAGGGSIVKYYNKIWYDRWKQKVLPSVREGPASIGSFDKRRNVLIKEGDTLSPGTLSFRILS